MAAATEHESLDALVAQLDDDEAKAKWLGLRYLDNNMDATVAAAKASMNAHDTALYHDVYRAIRRNLLSRPLECAELYQDFYAHQLLRVRDMTQRLEQYRRIGRHLRAVADALNRGDA